MRIISQPLTLARRIITSASTTKNSRWPIRAEQLNSNASDHMRGPFYNPNSFSLLVFASLVVRGAHSEAANFYEAPGVMPGEILRARGFHAQDHHIITKDHYQIRLTRALNPLINRGQHGRSDKIPILFIHGILESFSVFVINSFGASPKDFSHINLAKETPAASIERLKDEPSARSLPLLALNHGHEVWLMSRRGFPGSRNKLAPREPIFGEPDESTRSHRPPSGPFSSVVKEFTNFGDLGRQLSFSFDKRFWNYSLDEQAKLDVPKAIEYVLAKTGRKQLSVVGHSAGTALTLMALSMFPELNQKINSAILWAGTLAVGQGDVFEWLAPLRPALESFVGAVPPTFTVNRFQATWNPICSFRWFQTAFCERLLDVSQGPSGGEAPLRSEFINTLLQSTSSHELAQILQNLSNAPMRKYDFGPEGNRVAYGRSKPDAYQLERVTSGGLSFYVAATDFAVTLADVAQTRKRLGVAHKYHLIRAPFNHLGFLFHKDNARLVIIPSLREIQQFSERPPAS